MLQFDISIVYIVLIRFYNVEPSHQIDTELNDIDEKFDFRNTNDDDYIEYETKDKKDFFMTTASPPRSGQTQTINVSIANGGELGQVKQ